MPKVSIIIPVFNVEHYLIRCLDSVIFQTFSDWEAICVDDGSTDRSPEILDEYAAKDSRIKIIHKSNGGPSAARNEALRIAAGDFTFYLDSDDFLHPQTLEICLFMAKRDDSDLVAYTYHHAYRTLTRIKHSLRISDSKHISYRKYTPGRLPSMVTDNIFDWSSNIDYPGVCPNRKWLVKHCQAWRCMYRTSVINNIHFIDDITFFEDFPWWSEVLLHVRKATIINLPLYYYYPNKTSLIFREKKQGQIDNLKKAIAAAEALYKESATASQYEKWEKNFLSTFQRMLARKEL